METWKLLAYTTGLLLIWALLVSLLGYELTPWSIMFAAVFGFAGFYLSTKIVRRWVPEPDEN